MILKCALQVDYYERLNVRPYTTDVSSTHVYELRAVLMHLNMTIEDGHFFSYVLQAGLWRKFDDHKVTQA